MARLVLAAALAATLACAAPLDLVVIFDRTQPADLPEPDDLLSALEPGRRFAIASNVPEFRIHTPLTADPAAVERAVEEATRPHEPVARHPRLYKAARNAADFFDDTPGPTTRAVLFLTFNREKPSEKQTRDLIEIYRQRRIALHVIVLPSGRGGRTGNPATGGVICDPGPGCPPLGKTIQPDLGTLDRIAAATGGRTWRTTPADKLDWPRLISEISPRAAQSPDPPKQPGTPATQLHQTTRAQRR